MCWLPATTTYLFTGRKSRIGQNHPVSAPQRHNPFQKDQIHAYNGGLFRKDDLLDSIFIDDVNIQGIGSMAYNSGTITQVTDPTAKGLTNQEVIKLNKMMFKRLK